MYRKNIKYILILVLLATFTVLVSTSLTYGYWAGNISGSMSNANPSVGVGTWNMNASPDGIDAFDLSTAYQTDDIVWYNNSIYQYHGSYTTNTEPSNASNWTTLNDLNWYDTVTYRAGDTVYHNGIVYVAQWENNNLEPSEQSVNGAWSSMMQNNVAWVTGQASSLNDIVYHNGQLWIYKGYYTTSQPGSQSDWALLGDLTYSSSYVYANGDITFYNNKYYLTNNGGWASGSVPGTNSAWTLLNTPTWTNKVKNGTQYVLYNGYLYKALTTTLSALRNNQPGSSGSYGVWTALNTQQYQQYNTYTNGTLVMYNANVYELANSANSTLLPGTAANSWNLMNSMLYDAYSTYANGDYAIYNGLVYQVINQTNANTSAPGVIANSWNLLNGYDYYWYNTYQANDIVYYNDVVYKALTITTNNEPGIPSSSTYWAINS